MTIYTLKPGWEFNPLRKHRNIQCPCQSHKKAKNCCGRLEAVPEKVARTLRKYLAVHHPKGD